MKHWYNGRFCSLHFSCNCRALTILSTVPRLARKPHCDYGRIPLTIVRTNLFKIILENNFPTIDSRDMPLKLLQSDFEPFLYKDTSIAYLQSWGTSLSHTLWMICFWWSIIFSPPFFRISAVMLSIPSALLLFIWLTEAFISPLEGISSKAMIGSCCLMRSKTDSSTTGWRLIWRYIYTRGVRWVVCVGWSLKEGVCSRAYILKEFQTFYLVGCFVMDLWWWLIFRRGKGGIFWCFVLGRCCFSISQVIVREMFVSFSCHMYEDKEVLDA